MKKSLTDCQVSHKVWKKGPPILKEQASGRDEEWIKGQANDIRRLSREDQLLWGGGQRESKNLVWTLAAKWIGGRQVSWNPMHILL